jgi:hypothetical protein
MKWKWQIKRVVRAMLRVGIDWFWIVGPLLIIIPCWVYLSPQADRHFSDFVFDAGWTWCWTGITSILFVGMVKCRAETPLRGYVAIGVIVVMEVLMCWNLVALYTEMGTVPITWFGYEKTARPVFYGVILVLALVPICLGVKWFGKENKPQGTT